MTTRQYRNVPTYNEPRIREGVATASWYRFDQGIHLGTPPGSEVTVTVGASPFTYTAPIGGFAIVTGGTVSVIHFSRTSGVSYDTGQTKGQFALSNGDQLTITYSVKPAVVFVPQ